MPESRTRQLAAIMFADMVGYTALMQDDENGARAQRDRHRAIITAAVEHHHGRVLQYYGDGTLSIFSSAVEAVECAVAVQRTVSTEPLIPLRIGVHSGDIVHDADGVYGDGVNVASRIEHLSAPGGVMVSGKVFDEIKNHASLTAVPIGAVRLRKIDYRLALFAISNDGLTVPNAADVKARAEGEGDVAFTAPELTGEDGSAVPEGPVGAGEAFLKRVRERAIVSWMLLYTAGAFAVVQSMRFAGNLLHWSPLVADGLALIALIGFFVTVVVAWFHGEKGRQRIQRVEIALIGVLLVAGAAGLRLLPTTTADDTAAGPVVAPDDRPSIAVLPWDNRSGRSEDAYFADGIHDEILTRLSKIGGIRVISRQSVMQFRDSQMSARQIANELGVRFILQAGLLRVRDTVRVNVQLVDGRTEDVAWADSHDRYLTIENLLAIQAEIAQSIADTLRATVTPEEQAEMGRYETDNLEAYDFYLQGRGYYLRPGYVRANQEAAAELLERAIALDPQFALARAALSRVHGMIYWERFDTSEDRLRAQLEQAREALRLQPDLPQAHFAIGWAHYVNGDFQRALEEYIEARRGLPNDGEIIAAIGYTHRRLGNWPEVFAAFREASRLNPRDATLFYDLGGHSYGVRRRYEDAVWCYERATRLAPDFHDAALRKGETFVHWHGQLDSLRAIVDRLPADLHTPEIDIARADLALRERDAAGLLRLLEAAPAQVLETQLVFLPASIYAAWAHRLGGDDRAARDAFERTDAFLAPIADARPRDSRVLAALAFARAGLGRADDAAALADRVLSTGGENTLTRPQVNETAARIFAQAGLADRAIAYLDTLLTEDAPVSVHTIRLDPLYDPIRETPAFRSLLSRHAGPDIAADRSD